jgi:peptidoglycan hydrolase-like protein with peptidoglycan-binding domain
MMGRGARGDWVRNTQTLLKKAGAYQGAVDGWYGPKTENAVRVWQRFLSARPDGMWGADTNRRTANFLQALRPATEPGEPMFVPGVIDGG